MTSWPRASPIMKVVRVSWMADAVVPKSAAMLGNPGRYMSVARGATAVSNARTPTQLSGSGAADRSVRTSTSTTELIYSNLHVYLQIYM
jgi:hypothetical protein